MTHQYFVAWGSFTSAVDVRDYPVANSALKAALRVAKSSLGSLEDLEFNYRMLFGTTPGAVVAMAGDDEVFALLGDVAELLDDGSKASVDQFRDDVKLVGRIRRSLGARGETLPFEELRAEASASNATRFARLLSWMEKNAELAIRGSGANRFIEAGPIQRARPVLAATFRQGEDPIRPVQTWLGHYMDLDDDDQEEDDEDEPEEVEPPGKGPVRTPLPKSDRLPGVMRTYALRDGLWLLGRGRTKPDGSGDTTLVIKSWTGETVRETVLQHHVVRAFASFEREHIIFLDANLDLFVMDFMGSYVDEVSLARNPEVLSVVPPHSTNPKPRAAIRGFDISPESGDVVFSVIDRVWRFTSDGKYVWGRHLLDSSEPQVTNELARRPGTSLEILRDIQLSQRADWIYFLRISDRDDSVYVSTYAGHLLKFRSTGELLQHLRVDGPVGDILELGDDLIVSTERSGVFVFREGKETAWCPNTGVFYSTTHVVGGGLLNVETGASAAFPFDGLKGTYLVDGRLRVEYATAYLDIDLP